MPGRKSVLAAISNVYGSVSLTAAWHFNGTCSGIPIGTVYASGMANI